MRHLLHLALLTGAACTAATLDHTGWFPFPMAWNDTAHNVTDQAWSVDAPAGKYGFLQTTPEGHFRFEKSPDRVRFTGFVNVTSSNFPDSADAPLMAKRLRKLGTNLLRIHLVDNDWGTALYPDRGTTLAFDPVRLRKLDWFVKCLRDQGIYYNFCVQSARISRAEDGISAPVTNFAGKIVTLFDPRLIAVQKTWAKMLARHVNPYTRLAYGADPALVTWELTNENQFFLAWLSWAAVDQWDSLSPGVKAGMHPWYHRQLDTLWNRWLHTRYGGDAALRKSWEGSRSQGKEQIANGSFEKDLRGWGLWNNPASAARIEMIAAPGGKDGKKAMAVTIASGGTNSWDASINHPSLFCTAGKGYRLRFLVKGSQPTSIKAEYLQERTWTWYGASECQVGTRWSVCEAPFSAPATRQGDLRVQIDFGNSQGRVLIDSVSFRETSGSGLADDESLERFSVRRSRRATVAGLTDARAADEARFYLDLEARYSGEMTAYLRDSLRIRVPITFSNNWFGLPSIASQARADYLDGHAYWDHPDFSNGWSEYDFSMKNTPMVKDPGWGTIPSLMWNRVLGKPFVASEYNHPWPNQYLCEAPAFLYAYMGFLDADGALLHAYYDGAEYFKEPSYRMFFNSGMNPVLLVQQHLARLFRTGTVTPARQVMPLDVTESDMAASAKRRDGSPYTGSVGAALQTPTIWRNLAAAHTTKTDFVDPGARVISNTGEIAWDRGLGVLSVDNPHWQGLVGAMSAEPHISRLGAVGLATTGGRDFAAVHLVSADTQPIASASRLLLLTTARMENSGTVWAEDFRRIVKAGNAHDTVLCEPVTGSVWMLPGAHDSVSAFALDPTGKRRAPLPVRWAGDTLRLELPGTTLWYEIAKHEATSPGAVRARSSTSSR